MRIGTKDKTAFRNRISAEVVRIEGRIEALISSINYGEKLMDQLGNPVIADFISQWSASEMTRLAKLRMTLPVDARDDHLIIDAQYKAAEKFGGEPMDVESSVIENRITLERARDSLLSKQAQLKKLQE